MALRPKDGCTVFGCEWHKRAHDIDQILHRALWAAPHILIAVGKLFRCAWMDFDRLGQVQEDVVAVPFENRSDDRKHEWLHDKVLRHIGALEQGPEALCRLSVEVALAKRCLCEARI